MRCPACGARNPVAAGWCSQCYATLGESAGSTPPTSTPTQTPTPAPAPTPGAAPTATPHPFRPADRDVRDLDGRVEWRCHRCRSWTALTDRSCVHCGATRTGFATGDEASAREVPLGRAVAASVVVPGAGHVLLGATGGGIARMVLTLLWAAGGIALVVGPRGAVIGGILLLGAAVLWIASVVDAARVVAGETEVLGGRRLGVLVLVVSLALVVAATITAFGAAG